MQTTKGNCPGEAAMPQQGTAATVAARPRQTSCADQSMQGEQLGVPCILCKANQLLLSSQDPACSRAEKQFQALHVKNSHQ